MFRAVLFTQWKWARGFLLIGVCATFAIPLLSIRGGAFVFEDLDARAVLSQMGTWGTYYALAALTVGCVVAMIAWRADHAGRHVYALSLPIERWRYALLRFGAGGVTLAAPVVALWIGALVAVGTATLPAGLVAYPTVLALRFLLAVVLAYTLSFAAASTSPRIAGYVIASFCGLALAGLLIEIVTGRPGLIQLVGTILFDRYGLLHVFTGRWMLIDV